MQRATAIVTFLALAATASGCVAQERSKAGGTRGEDGGIWTTTSSRQPASPPQPSSTALDRPGQVGNGGPCRPEEPPENVPEGWVEYTDWSCDCRFYRPGSRAAMPPAPSWEPCPPSAADIDCRVMVVDWTDNAWATGQRARLERDQTGAPLLAYRQKARDAAIPYVLDLITEPDGPVRSAMMQLVLGVAGNMGCVANLEGLRDGYYVLNVTGHHVLGYPGIHHGAIGGAVDDLHPPVLTHWADSVIRSWDCGPDFLVREDSSFVTVALPWSATREHFITSPATDPDGMHATQPLWHAGHFFFATSTLLADGINVWDLAGGTRPFIRWPGDYTRGAADLGTDGVDLVWTYGEGKQPAEKFYPIRSVMTAPFTTEPAALQPRRLRSSPFRGVGPYPWRVGCGYAANVAAVNDIIIVRLVDGVSWLLPSIPMELSLRQPLGITCDEIFVWGDIAGVARIARIRLDSLGMGEPPD